MEPKAHLNLILLGKKRAGKSSSTKTILKQSDFKSNQSHIPNKEYEIVESGTLWGFPVTVYDTPGFCDPELSEDEIQQKIKNVLQKCESGHCVILLVIKADTFTEEDRKTVEKIEKLLEEKHLNKTWILFTRGDELEDENMTIEELLDKNKGLKKLIEKYDQRFHVFNNKKRGQSNQTRLLFVNILQRSLGLKVSEGRRLPRRIRPNVYDEPETAADSLSSRRIVLLGKTGVGKSAAGNTILGQKKFRSEQSMISVSSESSMKQATVLGRSVSVVDTPGFFDTHMKAKELVTEIARSVYLSSPGPHTFLIVLRANDRYTEQEQQIPQMIEMMFGDEVLKYSFILFTHGDQLKEKSSEKLIRESGALRHVVQQCGGRYQVFNNEDQNNTEQVNDLLQKIDTMIEQNGGGYYSNEMYEDAQRFRLEEKKRIQNEEKERKLQEEKQRQKEKNRAKLEKCLPEQRKREVKRMNVNVRESEAHKKSDIEKQKLQRETPEFKQFSKKYEKNFDMAAFAAGFLLSGTFVGGFIGLIIGAAAAGPVGAIGGAYIGAKIGDFFL